MSAKPRSAPLNLTYRQAEVCLALLAAAPVAVSVHTLRNALGFCAESVVTALKHKLAASYGRYARVLPLGYGATIFGEAKSLTEIHDHCITVLTMDGVDRLLSERGDEVVGPHVRRTRRAMVAIEEPPVVRRDVGPRPPLTVAERYNITLPKLSIQRESAA